MVAFYESEGRAVAWGLWYNGVDEDLQTGVKEVVMVGGNAMSVLKDDGSVSTAGKDYYVQADHAANLSCCVTKVVGHRLAFAALKDDGSVYTWGYEGSLPDADAASKLTSGVLSCLIQ